MPDDKTAPGSRQETPTEKRVQAVGSQSALAMELPFTLVGAVVVGGAIGYCIDKWLHTSPWLLLVFGGLGFFAGIREVLRRLPTK